MYKIYKRFFDDPNFSIRASCRAVPDWLGNFSFKIFSPDDALPFEVREKVEQMAALHPEQDFNTIFWQHYRVGESVKKHRDPKNNTGHTVIAVFGDFTGAQTTLYLPDGEVRFSLAPGDVLTLPCTIDGIQGPPHEVSPVISGIRFALILNTIDKESGPTKKARIDSLFS